MGGDLKTGIKTKNFNNAYSELEVVHCAVDLISGNNTLFDRTVLFSDLNNEAKRYFEHYGVKVEIEELAGFGGGTQTLLEFIKQLWTNKEIIGIIFVLLKNLYIFLIGLTSKNRPRVRVNLWLKIEVDLEYVEGSDLEGAVIPRLINIKNLSDGLCKILEEKYPVFVFDQALGIYIERKSFEIYYFFTLWAKRCF